MKLREYRVRVLKGREACSLGGPALHDGGGAGFLSYQSSESGPNSPPVLVFVVVLG